MIRGTKPRTKGKKAAGPIVTHNYEVGRDRLLAYLEGPAAPFFQLAFILRARHPSAGGPTDMITPGVIKRRPVFVIFFFRAARPISLSK